jgi:alpha-mannosidase
MKKLWLLAIILLPLSAFGADNLENALRKNFTKPIAQVSRSEGKNLQAKILAVYPTFFYVEEKGKLLQLVRVELESRVAARNAEVMAEADDEDDDAYSNPVALRPGRQDLVIKVPALSAPASMKIYLAINHKAVDEQTFNWPQAKLYKVYISFVSHLDIGYTNTTENVMKKRNAITERALDFIKQTDSWPDDAKYRWTMEGAWELKHFLEAHPERLPELKKLAQEGRLEVCAKLVHMHSETAGYEELFREVYYAKREAEQLLGVKSLTAMENDVDGFTWGEVSALGNSGVKYFSFNPNSFYRGGNVLHATKAPQAFYWQGPDGGQLLTWRSKDAYTEASYLFKGYEKTLKGMTELLAGYEQKGYAYDAIHITRSGADANAANDNSWPRLDACEVIKEWDAHFAYPKLISATPVMFFDYLEKNFGKQVPALKGDMPDWWADGVIAHAKSEAVSRDLHHRLAETEAFSAMASLLVPSFQYPQKNISDDYYKSIMFDEHTFGYALPFMPQHKQVFATKYGWLKSAHESALQSGQDAMAALAKQASGKEKTVVVFNPLSWPRDAAVSFAMPGGEKSFKLVDAQTNQETPCQIDQGQVYFIARDLPALGYKSFRIISGAAAANTGKVPAANSQMENERFALKFNDQKQLVSIKDKKLNRELLDGAAGQLIYRYQDNLLSVVDLRMRGKVKSLEFSSGPVFAEAVLKISDPGNPFAQLTQRIRLYQGLDYIDMVNDYKNYSSKSCEARYLTFPFKAPGFEIKVETPYARMRPFYDQFPDFAKFYAVAHSIELKSKSDNFSVVWSTKEGPMVELGQITKEASWTSQMFWPLLYHPGKYPWNPDQPHIYSEVMNNFQNTNFALSQKGSGSWSYRITALDAAQTDQVHQSGWELSMPASAVMVDSGAGALPKSAGLVKVAPGNVMLTELKRSEDGEGLILRVYEAEGRPAKAEIEFPLFKIREAWLTDGVEKPVSKIDASKNRLSIDLQGLEVKTIKIFPALD